MRVGRVEAFDVETDARIGVGPRPYAGDKIFAWQTCDTEGNKRAFRIDPNKKDPRLQAWLDDPSIEKVCHNLKFELTMLRVCGYTWHPDTVWHDTMIMSQLIDNLRHTHALGELAYAFTARSDNPYDLDLDHEVQRLARTMGGYHRVPHDLMRAYQEYDVERTIVLFMVFAPDITGQLYDDYRNEINLIVYPTIDMEARGIMVDPKRTADLLEWLETECIRAERELLDVTGTEINLRSPDQLAWLLYSHLRLPILGYTSTRKPSTKDEVIARLNHPAVDIIKRHRAYTKGYGIITGYLNLMDSDNIIHPNIQTNRAVTGREACSEPNLQNVSKSDIVFDEETGRQKNYPVPARRCFRPRPGHILMVCDQAGIELRLLIEAAGCQKMMDLMRDGHHPHVVANQHFWKGTARQFTTKKGDEARYGTGKNGHFCIWYGGSAEKFAQTIDLPVSQAMVGYSSYCREFPEAPALNREGIHKVKRDGHKVVTPFGRPLRIQRDEVYAWLNYYIQGTAAGIIKRGQTRLKPMDGVYPVLTVHDDIMFEIERPYVKYLPDIVEQIRRAMVDIDEIKVPLEIEPKISATTWDAVKEVNV